MKINKELEEERRKLNEEIEDIKDSISKMPGGIWAVITGAVISALCSLLALAGFWFGFAGLVIISVFAWLCGTGKVNEPVVITISSIAFALFPIFLIVFSLLGLFIWSISTLVLLLL